MERSGQALGLSGPLKKPSVPCSRHRSNSPVLPAVIVLLLLLSMLTFAISHERMGNRGVDQKSSLSSVFDSRFVPPHSDYAVDNNGNGLYDLLVIRAQVNITDQGGYSFGIDLFVGENITGAWVGGGNFSFELDVGLQSVDLPIQGGLVRASGHDGYFTAHLYMLNGSIEIDQAIYTTSYYSYLDFDFGPAFFEGPVEDYAFDANNNTKFDSLVLNISVNVTVLGDYTVDVWLRTAGFIGIASSTCTLGSVLGLQVAQVNFSGNWIYQSGTDGPYYADIYLWSVSVPLGPIDSLNYVTAAYSYLDFEPDFGIAAPVVDYGLDTDGDGLYNYLVVEVPVNLATAGDCDLYGILRPNPPFSIIDYDENYSYMDAGLGVMELYYDGKLISSSGFDGPYLVQMTLWSNGTFYNADHTTGMYLASQFERYAQLLPPLTSRPLDMNSNGPYDVLIVSADVLVEDENGYLLYGILYNDSMMAVEIEEAGNFSLLPVGTWKVDIVFSGWKIYDFGDDGPYYFSVELILQNGAVIDFLTGNTTPLAASDFEHPPEPVQAPWLETFDGGPFGTGSTADWSVSIPQSVSITTQTSESGTTSLAICGTSPYVEVLSPVVNISGLPWVEFRYWMTIGSSVISDPPDWDDVFSAYLWNSTDWVLIDAVTMSLPPGTERSVIINMSATPGWDFTQLRFIALRGEGPGTDYWHIDDVYIGTSHDPFASVRTNTTVGDLATLFDFDASPSWDIETPSSGLQYRWDWDGDGTWDTNWLSDPFAQHQFGAPGIYNITLEVMDSDGRTNITSVTVTVLDVIPEFQTLVLPIVSFIFVFAAVARLGRRRSR